MASKASVEDVRDSGLGPLVRMRALDISKLPAHPELASQQTAAPDVQTFVSAVLEEANAFMTTYLPHRFKVKDSGKDSPPATARVALSSHDISVQDLPAEVREAGAGNETWFARTSIHDNVAKDGTASWEEFDEGLRVDHSQHEKDYTPDVYDAHEALNWTSSLEGSQRRVGGWEDVHVSVMEMVHKIPTPLNDRVFPELVITAKRNQEFIVVQIPVASKGLPNAKYHNVPKITGESSRRVKGYPEI